MKPFYLQSPFPWKTKVKEKPGALISGLGYPLLFHGVSLGVLLGFAIFSAIRHSVPLMVFSLSYLAVAAVSWTWSRLSLQKVFLKANLSRTRVFPDESVTLSLDLSNGKWLPLPWVQIEEALPCRLASGILKTSSPYSRERLWWTTAISGWQRLKWQHHLICRARGEYRLWPPRLRTGDMFGLFPQEMILSGSESLLVYPRILSDSRLHLALTEFLGEREKTSRLYEDLSRPIGPRDYRPQDPFKRIHWKATARQGELQVKQFESSTGQNLLVLLDVRSFCEPKRQDEETFELAVSTAASITHELHGAGWPVGLIANAIPEIEIPVSSDRSQIRSILEALARVGQTPAGPLHALLERERVRSYPGTLFVIVTRDPSPSLVSVMRDIRKQGYSLFLVTFGNGPPEASLGGIPVFRASEQSPSPGSSEAVG